MMNRPTGENRPTLFGHSHHLENDPTWISLILHKGAIMSATKTPHLSSTPSSNIHNNNNNNHHHRPTTSIIMPKTAQLQLLDPLNQLLSDVLNRLEVLESKAGLSSSTPGLLSSSNAIGVSTRNLSLKSE
jgi:hypothetical protein